jgi:excisionase family DNA binding protein
MEQYLTPVEVCKIIRCSRRFVYDLLTNGRIEAHRPAGRWLITPQAVQAYVEGDRPGPGRPPKVVEHSSDLMAGWSERVPSFGPDPQPVAPDPQPAKPKAQRPPLTGANASQNLSGMNRAERRAQKRK